LLYKGREEGSDHYEQFGWTEEPRYEYVWPV
jgi:hypothetical protein